MEPEAQQRVSAAARTAAGALRGTRSRVEGVETMLNTAADMARGWLLSGVTPEAQQTHVEPNLTVPDRGKPLGSSVVRLRGKRHNSWRRAGRSLCTWSVA